MSSNPTFLLDTLPSATMHAVKNNENVLLKRFKQEKGLLYLGGLNPIDDTHSSQSKLK